MPSFGSRFYWINFSIQSSLSSVRIAVCIDVVIPCMWRFKTFIAQLTLKGSTIFMHTSDVLSQTLFAGERKFAQVTSYVRCAEMFFLVASFQIFDDERFVTKLAFKVFFLRMNGHFMDLECVLPIKAVSTILAQEILFRSQFQRMLNVIWILKRFFNFTIACNVSKVFFLVREQQITFYAPIVRTPTTLHCSHHFRRQMVQFMRFDVFKWFLAYIAHRRHTFRCLNTVTAAVSIS